MREFERARRDSAGTDPTGQRFPEDFSLDEAAFASELRELFPLEEEILPPHFIQTVMEDEWHSAPPPGFEQKLTYHVFSRLQLPRGPLFPQRRRAPWSAARQALTRTTRPLTISLMVAALMMIFSVIVATPSFAAGLKLLLAHTGVHQVDHYPAHIQTPTSRLMEASLSLTPTITISWLGAKADKYVFAGAKANPSEGWSDGPVIELQYTIPGDSPGTGTLDIREFKVAPNLAGVLQVVASGSASLVDVNGTRAIYVNGVWTNPLVRRQPMIDTPIWQFGTRSELMIERDGVVYWIVGDQRDGADQAELIKLASMLTATSNHILYPYPITLHGLGESIMQIFKRPLGRELLQTVPLGAALSSNTGYIESSGNPPL